MSCGHVGRHLLVVFSAYKPSGHRSTQVWLIGSAYESGESGQIETHRWLKGSPYVSGYYGHTATQSLLELSANEPYGHAKLLILLLYSHLLVSF